MTSLLDQIQRRIDRNNHTIWKSIDIKTSIHYTPLNGLIWASSATINHHFYVFGGVESNNENEISQKVRVSGVTSMLVTTLSCWRQFS